MLKKIGDRDVTDEEIEDLIREIDLDGDGQVDYEGKHLSQYREGTSSVYTSLPTTRVSVAVNIGRGRHQYTYPYQLRG